MVEFNQESRDAMVSFYFHLGLKQKEIVAALVVKHGYIITQRHLRRILRGLNLYRRHLYSDPEEVLNFLMGQMNGSGQLHGYIIMHQKCLQAGFTVSQEVVRLFLGILDPDGVNLRRRRRLVRRRYNAHGPNFLWHVDSYDKLKPYGICINGCIDGFSRELIWLTAWKSSSNPRIIAGYFINAVSLLNGCPRILRSDRGTENKYLEQMQKFLREDGNDDFAGEKSFLYGRSTANQRIENWWSFLRKENMEFWISHFQMLQPYGHFDGSELDKELIRFCYLNLIQVTIKYQS